MNDDPQEFLDIVYTVLSAMGVTSRQKVELASYQLRNVSQIWYTQWKDNRLVESGPIEWEVKEEKFINLKQGNMSVEEYSFEFSNFSRYAPSLVFNTMDEMSHVLTGVANLVREECRTTMLHDDMTLARLMVNAV